MTYICKIYNVYWIYNIDNIYIYIYIDNVIYI